MGGLDQYVYYTIATGFFSPDFLRGTFTLYNNLYPSRIITGVVDEDEEQKQLPTALQDFCYLYRTRLMSFV